MTTPDPCEPSPPLIPDHSMLRRIGRGSYGDVWIARNVMGIYRAVKVVYRDRFDSDRPYEREFEGIRKFEPISRSHESQVDILHVGDQKDYFYYVMELADDAFKPDSLAPCETLDPQRYVPKTLQEVLKQRGRLPFEDSLEIALDLTTALAHLHGHGLIHRDVKPSNIIFVNDIPKLADIGLVTETDSTLSYVGTEGFVPPEGPGGQQADLYGLGKVIYEMSTGRDRSEFPELPTHLREETDREGFVELNEVSLKACDPDASKRYEEAGQIQQDLLLLKAGKSLRKTRMLERHLASAKKIGVVLALAMFGLVAAYFYQRHQTEAMELLSRQERHQRERAETMEAQLRRTLYASDMRLAHLALEVGNVGSARRYLERHIPEKGETDLRGWEWRHFYQQCREDPHELLGRQEETPQSLTVSPDGRLLASIGGNRLVYFWDLASRTIIASNQVDGFPHQLAFSRDGTRLAGLLYAGGAVVWSVENFTELTTIPMVSGSDFCFSEDDLHLWTAGDFSVKQWNLSTGALVAELPMPAANVVRLSPDGSRLAISVVRQDHSEIIWYRLHDQVAETLGLVDGYVRVFAFSEDQQYLAAGMNDGRIWIWNRRVDEEPHELKSSPNSIRYMTFSANSINLATVDSKGRITWWDVPNRESVGYFQGPAEWISSLAISLDGASLFTGGSDGWIRIWHPSPPRRESVVAQPVDFRFRYALSPAYGHSFGLTGRDFDGFIIQSLSSTFADQRIVALPEPMRGFNSTGIGEGGHLIYLGWRDRGFGVFDSSTLEPQWQFPKLEGRITWPRFSEDNRFLALIRNQKLEIRSVENGAKVFSPEETFSQLNWARFIGKGVHAIICQNRRLILHDVSRQRRIADWVPHPSGMRRCTISPDRRWIVTGGKDGKVRIWHAKNQILEEELMGISSAVTAVAVSRDGTRLVAGYGDGHVVLWDMETKLELAMLLGVNGEFVDHLAFLEEDRTLMAFQQSRVSLWRTE